MKNSHETLLFVFDCVYLKVFCRTKYRQFPNRTLHFIIIMNWIWKRNHWEKEVFPFVESAYTRKLAKSMQ